LGGSFPFFHHDFDLVFFALCTMPKIIELIQQLQKNHEENKHDASPRGVSLPFLSFEYYAPKTDRGLANLKARLFRMKKQAPLFMDFTWGAGGSTADTTTLLADYCQNEVGVETNMHLTCTNMPHEKITSALAHAKEAGIRNIVALRGDPPIGQENWTATEGGFSCARDLVKFIRDEYGDYFGISVAGYPEGHPNAFVEVSTLGRELSASEKAREAHVRVTQKNEKGEVTGTKIVSMVCPDDAFEKELDYLKSKVDAGADFIMTQLFYDAQVFKNFVKAAKAKGINVPILPGIMPIANWHGFQRMTEFCRTRVPDQMRATLEAAAAKSDDEFHHVGAQLGVQMCRELKEMNVVGLHFFTLNLEKATYQMMSHLNILLEEDEDEENGNKSG
jgi:methylenetetrahydrofolate reductase (NADPH)